MALFSDRPERIVGTLDTTRFFDAVGFAAANPPNVAAVVRTPVGERDVLVIELFDPVCTEHFDADGSVTVCYSARVLDAYHSYPHELVVRRTERAETGGKTSSNRMRRITGWTTDRAVLIVVERS